MVRFMDIKNQLENKNFILRQLNNNDFDLLYNIGKNKKIWEQHPESDRWKREKFNIFLLLDSTIYLAFMAFMTNPKTL